MRIMMVTDRMDCGGAETHVESLAYALSGIGHEVTVASAGGRLAERMRRRGIRHITLPLSGHDAAGLARSLALLMGAVGRLRPHVLHAHARLPALLCHTASRLLGVPFVTTVHARFPVSPLHRLVCRWGRATVGVSEDLLRYAERAYGLDPMRLCLIPNGIDTVHFAPCRERKEAERRIVFVSRMDTDCSLGARLLCEIAPRLDRLWPGVKIELVGGGEAYAQVRELARRTNEALGREAVRAVGRAADARPYVRGAALFVGVSRAALEAMACGVPVVLCGNEGFGGLLTPSELEGAARSNFTARGAKTPTADALLDSVAQIIAMTAAERERLGASLRAYVVRYHDVRRQAERTAAFYRRAIALPAYRHADVVLLGYYGFGNCGDDALLRAAAERAGQAYPYGNTVALTRTGQDTGFGVRCLPRRRAFACLRHAQVLVLGGGTLLQDRTSLGSLLYYGAWIAYARLNGVRVCLWGNGLGVPCTHVGRWLMPYLVRLCDELGLRDGLSMALAERMGVERERMHREEDLALSVLRRYAKDLPPAVRKRRLLVVPSGGLDREALLQMCRMLREARANGYEAEVLAMHPARDRALSLALCRRFGLAYREAASPEQAVRLVRTSAGVVGARLHALVFAAATQTPFVGLSHDPKIQAFCREYGMKHCVLADTTQV